LDVGPTPKIASSLRLNATLLIDLHDEDEPKVLSCSDGEDCRTLIVCPSTLMSWRPTEIIVDEENGLVLVGDSENLEIHVFNFEGNVVHSIAAPSVVTSLAFKPGAFAPLSDVSLTTTSLTTMSPVTFLATGVIDRFGEPLTTDLDFSNFAIKATADISSEVNVVTIKTVTGTVSQGDGGEVIFSVNATNAGSWNFSLVDAFSSKYVRERSVSQDFLLLPAVATRRCLTCRCFHSRY